MYTCTLEKEGFLGTLYESPTPTEKAVILVGGSGEKRPFVEKRAQMLRDAGFHVLALGYYLWEPLPAQTVRIPLDYAEKAVAFLQHNPIVQVRRIGMTGISLGAAYTLLCASYLPQISCVAAVSGFDFVVEGCRNLFFRQQCSYFAYHGADVPYEPAEALSHLPRTLWAWKKDPRYGPYAMNRFYYNECFPGRTDASRIKVENIRGDILLLAPEYDDTWPSDAAVPRMMQVLEKAKFPYRYESVLYPKASHCLAMPSACLQLDGMTEVQTRKLLARFLTMEKQHPAECDRARQESWDKLVDFFRTWGTGKTEER